MEYQREEHCVHLIVDHLFFCPKRHKPIPAGEVHTDSQTLRWPQCEANGWEQVELAIQPDPVHLVGRVFPSDAADDGVKAVKGVTAELRRTYPHLLDLPSMWTGSVFASTAGTGLLATLQRSIEAQKGA